MGGVFVPDTQLLQLILKGKIIQLVAAVAVNLMEDDHVKFIFHSIGQHLIVSVTLGNVASTLCFIGVCVDNDVAFVFSVGLAGADLRVNRLFALHVRGKARVDNCSLHRVISFDKIVMRCFVWILL
nr:hypothetical protein [Phascolarctobacterium succinatutens]